MTRESQALVPVNGSLPLEGGKPLPEIAKIYSFFPDPDESGYLASAPTEGLTKLCLEQPDMAARFVHELWRIGRETDIIGLAKAGAIPDLSAQFNDAQAFENASVYASDLIASSSTMVHKREVSPEECIRFVCEAITLARMGAQGIETPEQFDDGDRMALMMAMFTIGEGIQTTVQQVQIGEIISSVVASLLTIRQDTSIPTPSAHQNL